MAKHKRIFATANDSKAIQTLCQEAERQGRSIAILWEILCVTNADPDLIAFPANCTNLVEMIELMGKEWGSGLQDSSSDAWLVNLQTEWLPVLQWVVDQRDTLQTLMPRPVFDPQIADRPTAAEVNPNYNTGVARHPIHAMLWCSYPKDDPLHSSYRLAQAHLLTAIVVSFHYHYDSPEEVAKAICAYQNYGGAHEWLGLPNSPSKACLTVRRLCSRQEAYQTYLQRLQLTLPPKDFAESLSHIDLPDNKFVIQRHKEFRLFLEKSSGLRGVITRRGISRGSYQQFKHFREPQEIGEGLIRRALDLADEDDPFLDSANPVRISLCQKRSQEEIKKTLDIDDDPWEEVDETGEDEFYVPAGDDANSPKRQSVPSWPQQRPILMANQLLPLSYRSLSQSEARTVVHFAEQWLRAHRTGRLNMQETEQLEAMTFLLTSLVTGIPVKKAFRIHIYPAGNERPGADARICLRLATQPGELSEWRIAVVHLPYLCHPDAEKKTQRRQGDYLILPDVLGVSRFFTRLRQAKRRQIQDGPSDVQADAPIRCSWRITSNCFQQQHKILQKIDAHSRITNTKVAGYLFSRMMVATGGDVTASAIVAGSNLPLARARLFYACTRLRRIQECYVSALEGLLPEGTIETKKICWDTKDTWIATRPCPTEQAVRDAVQLLEKRLERQRPYHSMQDYIEYHNLYTLRTLWHCSFATSYRPIRSPLFFPDEIECDQDGDGIAWINDKNVGKGYTARLAWIPADVAKQVQYYANHLSAVRREIRFRYGEGSIRHPELLVKSCIFLDSHMQPVEVREKSLEALMYKFLEYPVNIHRRFVSAELLDRGVASEAVDWWMGHWHLGEEPWGKYSGLSFAEYRAQLRPLIDLLGKLGFCARRSAVDPQKGA
jgi:hypothetical protein